MAEQGAIILYSNDEEESFSYANVHTPHIASALLDDGLYDEATLQEAMHRAIQVCIYMHVPVAYHFRHIYIQSDVGHVQDDWALSDFAFYLLLLNGNVAKADMAYAQAYAIRRAFARST